MKSRFALSFAPILMFALGQQAHAATTLDKPGAHTSPSRTTTGRHAKTRVALATSRHNRHVTFRHLAVRHVEGRHVAYGRGPQGLTDSDGWNPIVAGISYPSTDKPIGASVHLTSYTAATDSGTDAADIQTGVASYYGGRHNGRRTSSGTIFNEHEMTAAHATLPFGTKVLVQIPGSDRSVVVTITDRLYSRHRIIDLSAGAAQRLGILHQGLAMVTLTPTN